MIETGTLVLWSGAFTRSLPKDNWIGIVSGEPPISWSGKWFYTVIFANGTSRCLIDELEVIA